jgi:galactokinase
MRARGAILYFVFITVEAAPMAEDESLVSILTAYRSLFGEQAALLVTTPGRVNLIGEHTDYNGGWVLPFAIDRVVRMAAGEGKGVSVLHALDKGETVEFDAGHPPAPVPGHWSNYPIGVTSEFLRRGLRPPQIRAVFAGTIPPGGGLSSSAALENSMALLLDHLAGTALAREDLARISQAAEHDYAGVRCGIMDQYATLLGREGSALLIDCRSGEYRRVPMRTGPYRFMLCNSMVRHELSSSGYNDRRRECERALAGLQSLFPGMRDLRDATLERLRAARDILTSAEYRRALHQVEENARVLEAERALREGDTARLGKLMGESHRSLRDNFEVTIPETDFLAETAAGIEGVAGARMTGGGFGGNVIALVRGDRMEAFAGALGDAYRRRFGVEAGISECKPSEGGHLEVTSRSD